MISITIKYDNHEDDYDDNTDDSGVCSAYDQPLK